MEPIICECGEPISDKYELFRSMYKPPFEIDFNEVCKKLYIHKQCTKIHFLTTVIKHEIPDLHYKKKFIS